MVVQQIGWVTLCLQQGRMRTLWSKANYKAPCHLPGLFAVTRPSRMLVVTLEPNYASGPACPWLFRKHLLLVSGSYVLLDMWIVVEVGAIERWKEPHRMASEVRLAGWYDECIYEARVLYTDGCIRAWVQYWSCSGWLAVWQSYLAQDL